MKTTIADLQKKHSGKIDSLDLELLIAHVLKKPREFVLAHPEYEMPPVKIVNCELKIARRMKNEPLAYILGSKEFFGLPFLVSPATLIPRPETELMVEEALRAVQAIKQKNIALIDIGTGSGNIIISIAKNLKNICHPRTSKNDINFYGIDISKEALQVAKHNAKKNNVDKEIKFIHGNLLEPILKNQKFEICNLKFVILANLPYLSKEIYNATSPTVKKFEPKSALYSKKGGLDHYEKLFQQMNLLKANRCQLNATLEFSPEQKNPLAKLIKKYFPKAMTVFKKDLAGKWRLAIITL